VKNLDEEVNKKGKIFQYLYKIVIHPIFDTIIMSFIIINTIILAIKWYDGPKEIETVMEKINYGFAGVFTLEVIMKMPALGVRNYFHSGWNSFDFFIVCGTLISIIVSLTTSVNVGTQATIVRAFRIGRIF
jgi:hypothetical protein